MDFGALPPEKNSALMFTGPGSWPMLAAATAWDRLADDLYSSANSFHSVIGGLTDSPWQGPASVSMVDAAAAYVSWLTTTAAQAEVTATQARQAAKVFEAAVAATVPPPVIAANRAQLASLIATNDLGQNAPAIAAAEAYYGEMWAQDATAMYGYAGDSAAVSILTPFVPPTQTTNATGPAAQAAAIAQAAGTSAATHAQSTLSQVTSALPQVLQGLAEPWQSTSSTSGLTSLQSLSSLSSPVSACASTMSSSASMLSSLTSTLKTLGPSTAAATQAAGSEITFLGSALAGGLGSGTAVLGSTPSAALGAGGGAAVSAGMGRAYSLGALSIPQSWAAASLGVASPAAAVLPPTSAPATPAFEPPGLGSMFGGLPMASSSARGEAGVTPQVGPRPAVVPRSPAIG